MSDERQPARRAAVTTVELLGAIAACLAVAAAFTWPLILRLDDAIPAGGEAPTVALFNLSVVEHLGAVLRGEAALWDLRIFAPHAGTWAWSELQPLSGLIHAGLVALGLPSIAAYDAILLVWIAGGGVAAWLAARQLTDDRVAAFAAAAWTTGGAFVAQRAAALHLVALVFPLLALWAVVGQADGFNRRRLWLACVAVVATWLTCGQYLILLAPLLLLAGAVALPWRQLRARQIAEMGAAALVAAAVVVPSAMVWREQLAAMGMSRSPEAIIGVAQVGMLVQPPVGHWLLPAAQPFAGAGAGALTWDVGVVLLATGLAGLAAAGGRPRRIYGEAMRAATAWATVGIAATLAALAPHLQVAGIEPWALLCSLIPGLSAVRAPARLVLFSAFAVAVLAAPALGWLRQRWPRARLPITVACMALLAAEMWTMPVALVQPDVGVSDHDEPLRWLAAQDDGRPLLELPMTEGVSTIQLERGARAMRRAVLHGHPLINGYSGYLPEPFWQLADAMRRDPGGRGRRYLAAMTAGWVLFHEHQVDDSLRRQLRSALPRQEARRFGSDVIFELPPTLPASGLPPVLDLSGTRAPVAGQLLSVPLFAPTNTAMMLGPAQLPDVTLIWPGPDGLPHQGKVILRGTVLLDRGDKVLVARLLKAPRDDEPGEAVLAGRELVAQAVGP